MAIKGQDSGSAKPITNSSPQALVPGRPTWRGSATTWCAVGFAAATLFWSVTGAAPDLGAIIGAPTAPEHTSSITPIASEKLMDRLGSVTPNCTVLILDRSESRTRPDHCSDEETSFSYAEAGRQNLLLSSEQAADAAEALSE